MTHSRRRFWIKHEETFEQLDGPKLFINLNQSSVLRKRAGRREAVFESPGYQACLNSGSTLTLFIDSLDECLLRVDNVAAILAGGFAR
jgi:hypothetical protein